MNLQLNARLENGQMCGPRSKFQTGTMHKSENKPLQCIFITAKRHSCLKGRIRQIILLNKIDSFFFRPSQNFPIFKKMLRKISPLSFFTLYPQKMYFSRNLKTYKKFSITLNQLSEKIRISGHSIQKIYTIYYDQGEISD